MREICHDQQEIIIAHAIAKWHRSLSENGMKINPLKSEVIILSRARESIQVFLEGHQLNQANYFKYLGLKFNKGNSMIHEINHRITKYSGSVSKIYQMLRDKNIQSMVKVLIYKSILRPILTHGSEAWSLTTKTETRIQVAEMRVLRMIKSVT